jgi:hypothetical protein
VLNLRVLISLSLLMVACGESPHARSKVKVVEAVAVPSGVAPVTPLTVVADSVTAPKRAPAWSLEAVGFDGPESVYVDAVRGVYLVSNVAGDPTYRDDNGFISKISADGKLLKLKWIDGAASQVTLHAPKGMAVVADTLYVADIDTLRAFEVASGKPKSAQKIEGATSLNDVAVGVDGAVYVSDSGVDSGAIYRVDGHGVHVVASGEALHRPNGLWADETGLWAVTLGGAELYEISSGARLKIHALGASQLDGIAKTVTGHWLVSSWRAHAIIDVTENAGVGLIGELQSPADFAIDMHRNQVVVPCMQANAVYAFVL